MFPKKNYIKTAFIIVGIISILFYLVYLFQNNSRHIAVGLGNPGKILVFDDNMNKVKELDSGFNYVHTVRSGVINNRKLIVAGVSNSFFTKPYGCSIIAFESKKFNKELIDEVGDLRCKDITFGDVDNDGIDEIVLGTHGMGIVRIYRFVNNSWRKENIEFNYIAKIDKIEETNHRVPSSDLPCGTCLIQTAVHIVKIADIDNDGKNEVIVTMSSPLELKNIDEISYIRIYKIKNNKWISSTIDSLKNREFRSILVGDIYHKGKNTLVVGIGSPRGEKGSLYSYEYNGSIWEKKIIYNDVEEKNMKGIALTDTNKDGKKEILLATGFPKANILLLSYDGVKFAINSIGSISDLFKNSNAEYNSMAVSILSQSPIRFVVSGMTTFPKKSIGWEGSSQGFTVLYQKKNDRWIHTILDRRNALALD